MSEKSKLLCDNQLDQYADIVKPAIKVHARDEQGRPVCGAKNRQGKPCQCKKLYRSGRCKFHGGLSTGPKKKPPPAL